MSHLSIVLRHLQSLTEWQPELGQSITIMSAWDNDAGQYSNDFHQYDPPLPVFDNSGQEDFLQVNSPYNGLSSYPAAQASIGHHTQSQYSYGSFGNDALPVLATNAIDVARDSSFLEDEEGQNDRLDFSSMEMSDAESSMNPQSTMPTSLHSSDNENSTSATFKQQSPDKPPRSEFLDPTTYAGSSFLQLKVPTSSPSQEDASNRSLKKATKITKKMKNRQNAKGKGKALSPRAEQVALNAVKIESPESTPNTSPLPVHPMDEDSEVKEFFREPTDMEREHLEAFRQIPIQVVCEWLKRLRASPAGPSPTQPRSDAGSNTQLAFSVVLATCRRNGIPSRQPQTERRRWACTCCTQSYPSKWNWRRHEESNLFDWPCPQDECSAVYPRQDKIPEHLRKHHGITSKADPKPRLLHLSFRRHCGLCGEIFEDPSVFLDHVALHWDGKKASYASAFCTMEQWRWYWPNSKAEAGNADDDNDDDHGNDDDGNDGDNDQSDSNYDFDQGFNNGGGYNYNGNNATSAGPSNFTAGNSGSWQPFNGYFNFSSSVPVHHHGATSSAKERSLPTARSARTFARAVAPRQVTVHRKPALRQCSHSPAVEPLTRLEKFQVGGISNREGHVETVSNQCKSILRTFSDTTGFESKKFQHTSTGLGNPLQKIDAFCFSGLCPACHHFFNHREISASNAIVCPKCHMRIIAVGDSELEGGINGRREALGGDDNPKMPERGARRPRQYKTSARRQKAPGACLPQNNANKACCAESQKVSDRSPSPQRHLSTPDRSFVAEKSNLQPDIAITGMSSRWPNDTNEEYFWNLLVHDSAVHGQPSSIGQPWNLLSQHLDKQIMDIPDVTFGSFARKIDPIGAKYFQMPYQAASYDPQQRLLLLTVHDALEKAGLIHEFTPPAVTSRRLPVDGKHRQISDRHGSEPEGSRQDVYSNNVRHHPRSSFAETYSKSDKKRDFMDIFEAALKSGQNPQPMDPHLFQIYTTLFNYIASLASTHVSPSIQDIDQGAVKGLPIQNSDNVASVAGQISSLNQLLMLINLQPTQKVRRLLEKGLSEYSREATPYYQFIFDLSVPRLRSHLVVKGLVNGTTGQVNLAMQFSTGTGVLSRFLSSSFERLGLRTKLLDLARNQNFNIAWTSNERGPPRANKYSNNVKGVRESYDEIQQIEKHLSNGGNVTIHRKAVARPLQLLTGMCEFHLQHALPICSNVEPISPTTMNERIDSPNSQANLRQKFTKKLRDIRHTIGGHERKPSTEAQRPRLAQGLKGYFPRAGWGRKRSRSF